jgi:hypothetical protein
LCQIAAFHENEALIVLYYRKRIESEGLSEFTDSSMVDLIITKVLVKKHQPTLREAWDEMKKSYSVIFHASLEMKNLDHDTQSKNKEIIVSIRDKCVELQYFVEDPLQIHKETLLDECIVRF